jgi:hypothetical protein
MSNQALVSRPWKTVVGWGQPVGKRTLVVGWEGRKGVGEGGVWRDALREGPLADVPWRRIRVLV